LHPGNEKCNRNAIRPTDTDDDLFTEIKTCGSCDVTQAEKNVFNNTCFANNDLQCGADLVKCQAGQQCFKGKCICSIDIAQVALSWEPFIDADPDRDNKLNAFGTPATGCNEQQLRSVLDGTFSRVFQSLGGFRDCIARSGLADGRSGIDRFTPVQFANKTFRSLVCPGGEGKCPGSFCDALFANATGADRSNFCAAVQNTAQQLKQCATNFKVAGKSLGDVTCANVLLLDVVSTNERKFTFLEAFNFLGCDKPRDDMIMFVADDSAALSQPFRVETARVLFGDAGATGTVSAWVLIVVAGLYLVSVTR
jgi:hypothetical protein